MSSVARPPLMLVPQVPAPASEPPAALVDDQKLIAGLKARDTTLSGAFYDRVRPLVDRTLMRLLGVQDGEYEDVAQRSLFELVNGIDTFRGDCPLDAWISIVTARIAFRTIRRRRVERRLFSDQPIEEHLLSSRSHASAVAARQAIERVRRELEQMDPNRSLTFLLHDLYGYDLREISQITGVSVSAAQSRLVRGRHEIHERIRNDEALARFLSQRGGDP